MHVFHFLTDSTTTLPGIFYKTPAAKLSWYKDNDDRVPDMFYRQSVTEELQRINRYTVRASPNCPNFFINLLGQVAGFVEFLRQLKPLSYLNTVACCFPHKTTKPEQLLQFIVEKESWSSLEIELSQNGSNIKNYYRTGVLSLLRYKTTFH